MRIRLLLGFVILLALVGTLYPQTPAAAPQRDQTQGPINIPVNVVEVPLMVSVTDNRGKLITNLKKEDFKIYEDDEQQKIGKFSSDKDLPLSIALLVDASGSIIDKLKFEQAAAADLFFNTVKRKKDRAMVIGFDATATIHSDSTADGFTDVPERLADAVKLIHAGGASAVYDAVYLAIQKKLAFEETDRRKLIILISDGDDNSSRFSLTETLDIAQRHNVAIYSISTNKTSDTRSREKVAGDDVIRRMADETGGKAYFPLKLDDLASDFQKIGDEIGRAHV